MKLAFDDPVLDDQLKRTAAAAYAGAADLGEMLVAAAAVTRGDPGDWYAAWSAAAERAEAAARGRADRASRAGAWLRAAEYWRQAYFFLRDDLAEPRLHTGWSRHRAAYRAALPLLPLAATIAEIPFGTGQLTGYLLRPAGAVLPRPTVILPAGYDSTAESAHAETGWMALARGMNVFALEGPGQGGTLYRDRIPMRPDYERVLSPALDWLLGQEGVDAGRLVLLGRSLAGYLAPRAAAHEGRIAALVCDPGQVEFASRIRAMLGRAMPGDADATWAAILGADPAMEARLQQLLEEPSLRAMLAPRMLALGAGTLGEFMRRQAAFSLEGLVERIRCPTLVVDCAGDFAAQSDALFALLRCDKTMTRLEVESGAGGHCGGLGQQVWAGTVFPWIARTLNLGD
jgi:hypothetical protein